MVNRRTGLCARLPANGQRGGRFAIWMRRRPKEVESIYVMRRELSVCFIPALAVVDVRLDQWQLGSIVQAIYFLGTAIIIAAVIRAVLNR